MARLAAAAVTLSESKMGGRVVRRFVLVACTLAAVLFSTPLSMAQGDSKAPSPPDAAANESPADPYAKARADCEQDQDPDRQIAGCTVVIESGREPQAIQGIANSNRGFGYFKRGDLDSALSSYSESIRLYPEYANAFWGRADVHMQKGAWDEAIRDYTASLRLEPNEPYTLFSRGRAYLQKEAWREAVEDFTKVLDSTPTDAAALNNRAVARLRLGHLDHALADVSTAIGAKPDFAEAMSTRGDIWQAKGDIAAAVDDYDRALKLEPGLASALDGRRKAEESRARNSTDQRAPSKQNDLDAGFAAFQAGDFATARRLFMAEAERGIPQAEYNLAGMHLLGKGMPADSAEAARWFRRAADRGHLEAQNHLGVLYDNGDGVPRSRNEAIRWFRLAAQHGHEEARRNLRTVDPSGAHAAPTGRTPATSSVVARQEYAGAPPALIGQWGLDCSRPNVGFQPGQIQRLDIKRDFPISRTYLQGNIVEVEYGDGLRETFWFEGEGVRWLGRVFPSGSASARDPAVWKKCG